MLRKASKAKDPKVELAEQSQILITQMQCVTQPAWQTLIPCCLLCLQAVLRVEFSFTNQAPQIMVRTFWVKVNYMPTSRSSKVPTQKRPFKHRKFAQIPFRRIQGSLKKTLKVHIRSQLFRVPLLCSKSLWTLTSFWTAFWGKSIMQSFLRAPFTVPMIWQAMYYKKAMGRIKT